MTKDQIAAVALALLALLILVWVVGCVLEVETMWGRVTDKEITVVMTDDGPEYNYWLHVHTDGAGEKMYLTGVHSYNKAVVGGGYKLKVRGFKWLPQTAEIMN